MLRGSQGISVEKSPSSSTALDNESFGDPIDALIRQLKMKVVNVDLFHTIKDNPTIIYEIKALLKQLSCLDAPDSILFFVLDFEPFLEQTAQNVKLKKEYAKRLK